MLNLSCAPLAGAAVYAWHCDREGRYSLYSSGVTNQNYLRGIQVANSSGTVTFTSKTSQIALPRDTSVAVYATTGYSQSVTNLSRITLASDMVFGDDLAAGQMATLTGSVTGGYVATLTATVNV